MSFGLYSQISNSNIKSSRRAWHESLIDYFELIKTMEDRIDLIRASLCSEKNFNPKKLFEYIDKKDKNKITLNDLISILQENNIDYKEENLRKFIHNFDKDNDFCLNYNEYIGIIFPRKDKLLQKNFITSIQYKNKIEISQNIIKIFCNILIEEMKLIDGCNKIVKEIQDYSGFTPYEAFLDITNGEEIYINEKNLSNFLKRNNIEINKEDSHQLLFRLDRDNDGRISYEEFQNMLFLLKDYKDKDKNNSYINTFINERNNDDIVFNIYDKSLKTINNRNNISNTYIQYYDEDISPIRNENNIIKEEKDINTDLKKNNNIIYEKTPRQNEFYDSLETSKNQDNSEYDYNKNKKSNSNINNNKVFKKDKSKNFIYEKEKNYSKILEEKIKKVFQIPQKEKNFFTPMNKKEENKKIIENEESPKFSCTKEPLYYDYSTDSKNNKNIIKNKNKINRYNSAKIIHTPNLCNQETDYITNNINQISNNLNNTNIKKEEISNQTKLEKQKKNNKIPFSTRKNENNNITLFNVNNTFIENSKNDDTFNKSNINKKNNSSFRKVVNNLFKNNFNDYKDNNNSQYINSNKTNNNKEIEIKKNTNKKPKIKKEINLQNLILHSPFPIENSNKKDAISNIKKSKNNLILQMFNKNINKNENISSNYEDSFKNLNNNIFPNKHELTEVNSFKQENNNNENYDFNDYEHNISTSLINNPSITNQESCYSNFNMINNNDYYYSNTNIEENNKMVHNDLTDSDNIIDNTNFKINKTDIKTNKNDDNFFTLDGSNINKIKNNDNLNYNTNPNIINQLNNNLNYIKNSSPLYNNDNDNDNSNFTSIDDSQDADDYSSKKNLKQIQYERYNNLYNLLYDFLKWEIILENIKYSLSLREDINTKFIFELFDTKKRNQISLSDISKTLKYFGLNIKSEDAQYIFLKYNKRLKDKFNYNEFCEMILPNVEEKRKKMEERILNNNYRQELTEKTKSILCLLFQKIIEGERSNEFYRNNLSMVPNSSGYDLFNLMKKNYSVGINKEDIDTFLSSRGKVFYNNESDLIMKKLDKNKNGIIDYAEFISEITPKFIF